jgi:hypothetical protein
MTDECVCRPLDSNIFQKHPLVSSYCRHLRFAPEPAGCRNASCYIDIVASLGWSCGYPNPSDNKRLCSRNVEPFLQVDCKQRSNAGRVLTKPIYVSLQISSLDPHIAVATDGNGSIGDMFSTTPRRIDATQEIQDFDTPGFRLHWRFPVFSADNPVATHKFAKFTIVGIAKYTADPARDFKFSGNRKVVIAASLYPSICLPPSMDVRLDKLRAEFELLFEGHNDLFLSNVDVNQTRKKIDFLDLLRSAIRIAGSDVLSDAVAVLKSSELFSVKLANLKSLVGLVE